LESANAAQLDGPQDGAPRTATTRTRKRALDHLRAYRLRPVQLVPVEALVDVPCQADTADEALAEVSTEEAIALLAALPRREAEAIILRVIIGLDAADAARILGTRAGAVRSAAYRGLRRLATRIESAAVPRPLARVTYPRPSPPVQMR
jgi:RNA polymerase sigma-70 factor, ECF subfamily